VEGVNTPTSASDQPRTAIVTGANSGVGLYTATKLAEQGYRVVLAVRNAERGRVAQERILDAAPGAAVETVHLDLASLRSIKECAAELVATYQGWDVLVNDAAAKLVPERLLTEDGFEWNLGVNFLGHFALTGLLLTGAMPTSRVVNVTSLSARNAKIRFHDLRWDNKYRPGKAYAMSKFAQLVFSRELDRRCKDDALPGYPHGLRSVAAHPGRGMPPAGAHRFGRALPRYDGPDAVVYAATSDDLIGGELVGPSGRGQLQGASGVVAPPAIPDEVITALRLWRIAAQLTRVPW
jgi:NAD(P)-dependent dehydrogenase (short-subunit alcohol dehydrogenase family)